MTNHFALFLEVIVPLAVPGSFTYGLPHGSKETVQPGSRVVVQFGKGKKLYTAVVRSLTNEKPSGDIKPILEIIDEQPLINARLLQFWDWMATYYMCTIGEVMHAALPGMLNLSSESRVIYGGNDALDLSALDPVSLSVLNILERHQEMRLADLIKQVKGSGLKSVKLLAEKSALFLRETIVEKYKPRQIRMLALHPEVKTELDLQEKLDGLKRAAAQSNLLMTWLQLSDWEEGKQVEIRRDELLKQAEASAAVLKALIDKKILTESLVEESRLFMKTEHETNALNPLNELQQKALNEIRDGIVKKEVMLLHGVTSSGKTEVYAHLIDEVRKAGKQVLYLLPEIALTNQLIKRLRKFFGHEIGVYHSRMGQNEQVEMWKNVAGIGQHHFNIVLGARSALFLPFTDLGLVIVDEEHDRSFKQQDPAPRYSARDGAIVRAMECGAKVVLGSATPSLESLFNARSGKYGLVEMKKRFGGFLMPEMEAIDLQEARKKRQLKGSFSQKLIQRITETLEGGEQVILFRNQRGYAPFLLCDHCSHTPMCIHCDVSLTLHKRRDILLCHYCGYQRKRMLECPECHIGQLSEVGMGTEKIEEEMAEIFPEARLARFDLDSTSRKHAFQQLIDDFESHDLDVLIGTQMVTKGLDFENVGLVGIINADNMMRFPDFRSFERTFQMLTQVAGRTGRKKKRGQVIIQTYDPFHPVIQRVLESNYNGFVETELLERQSFHYPPFTRIIELVVQHRDRQTLYEAARFFGDELRKHFGRSLLGPEFPRIERLRNLYAMHFILKFDRQLPVQQEKKKLERILAWFTSNDNFRSIKVKIDVDPY